MNFKSTQKLVVSLFIVAAALVRSESICAQEDNLKADAANDSSDAEIASDEKEDPAPSGVVLIRPMFAGSFWDLEIEGGYGLHSRRDVDNPWMGRIRAGVLEIQDPWFASLGLGFELGGLTGMGAGIHGVLSHYTTGMWAQGFANLSFERNAVVGAAVGWSVLGIEMQVDPDGHDTNVLALLRIRMPIAILVYGLTKMRGVP